MNKVSCITHISGKPPAHTHEYIHTKVLCKVKRTMINTIKYVFQLTLVHFYQIAFNKLKFYLKKPGAILVTIHGRIKVPYLGTTTSLVTIFILAATFDLVATP